MVELPDNLHGELKKKAAAQHATMKTVITELIEDYLSAPSKEQARGKKTGLCGSWDDERSAEEIIRDVRGRRTWFTRRKA
jgi:hypothetical protein